MVKLQEIFLLIYITKIQWQPNINTNLTNQPTYPLCTYVPYVPIFNKPLFFNCVVN